MCFNNDLESISKTTQQDQILLLRQNKKKQYQKFWK